MVNLSLIFIAFLFTGCASRGEKLSNKYPQILSNKIITTPFIAQTQFHCGPAALAMMANFQGENVTSDEISKMIYSPGSQGTFQNDLLAATRRKGLLALPVGKMKNLLVEISAGNPVLVFQNLGLSWLPRWHYAVVVGYDLKKNIMILHSGEVPYFQLDLATFERTWQREKNWGLVFVKPGTLSNTATESDMVVSTAGIELAGHLDVAKVSYKKILDTWPQSFGALVGMGNILYKQDDLKGSIGYLKQATSLNPKAAAAWYNYALALYADQRHVEAREAAEMAIKTSDRLNQAMMTKNLEPLLKSGL